MVLVVLHHLTNSLQGYLHIFYMFSLCLVRWGRNISHRQDLCQQHNLQNNLMHHCYIYCKVKEE